MNYRALLILAGVAVGLSGQSPNPKPFTVVEASIPEMRAAMEQGGVTSRERVTQYLIRIAQYDDKLHATITVNPHALEEADALDPTTDANSQWAQPVPPVDTATPSVSACSSRFMRS